MAKTKPIEILDQIFSEMINVTCIAVATKAVSLEYAKKICSEKNYDYHLIKKNGSDELLLYVNDSKSVQMLSVNDIISESTPILDVMLLLQEREFLFIKEKQKITSIVTRADLNSIPVRIYLFGLISLFEMQMRKYIMENIDEWEESLSIGRLEKAKDLLELKKKRNEDVNLIECLQLCDLSLILKRNWKHFYNKLSGFERGLTVKSIKKLNDLRDELAHAQNISINHDDTYSLVLFVGKMLNRL